MDESVRVLVDAVKGLSPDDAFRMYLKLAAETPDKAQIAALALRDKARAGEISEALIPLLAQCMVEAPDDNCLVHFAKALAAFGRKAEVAGEALVHRTGNVRVVDDTSYWILDGCIWALGYMGGAHATAFIDRLEAEKPSRAIRSASVYQGEMTVEDRGKRWAETLVGVRALIAQDDPGVWREKKTTLKPKSPKPTASKKPWTVR
jgi:hypothetical protein